MFVKDQIAGSGFAVMQDIMRRRTLKFLSGVVAVILLLIAFLFLFIEPWMEKKILSAINNIDSDYVITVKGIDVMFFPPGVEWDGVRITSKGKYGMDAEFQSIKFKGVSLMKFIFKNDL